MGMEEPGGAVIWRETFTPRVFFQKKRLSLLQLCRHVQYLGMNVIWKDVKNLYCTEQELGSEPMESHQETRYKVRRKNWLYAAPAALASRFPSLLKSIAAGAAGALGSGHFILPCCPCLLWAVPAPICFQLSVGTGTLLRCPSISFAQL